MALGSALPFCFCSCHKFRTADYVVLIFGIELVEVAAPAPYTNNEVFVCLGVLLRIEQHISVYRIKLKLMPSKVYKGLDECGDLFYSVTVAECIVVYLHRERSAVDYFAEIVLCKGLNTGKRSAEFRYGGR